MNVSVRRLLRGLALISFFSVALHASLAGAEPATLTGQVVCSSCWDEQDRDKVPYGNADDLKCWKKCSVKGVPSALAVTESGATHLVILEYGSLKKTSGGWLPFVGKRVEVRGTLRPGEKPSFAVDEIRVLPAEK